jgi:predicted HTH transcriptional regulator
MQTQSTLLPESTLGTPAIAPRPAVVPQRSTRRATARRASNRRATARLHKDNIDGRIFEYVKEHPQSTTGDMAKGLNASRNTIAAEISHMVRAGELTKKLGSRALSTNE